MRKTAARLVLDVGRYNFDGKVLDQTREELGARIERLKP